MSAVEVKKGVLSGLTLEHALYGLILLASALTRLLELGRIPLSPGEAGKALAVWNTWQSSSEVLLTGSPAYYNLTVLLSQLLGFSDSAMRFVPAVFGVAAVLLPWWLRSYSGRIGALTASLLMAVSPLLVITSRTAGGLSIAYFAGLLLLVSWLNYQDTGRPKWMILTAVSLALGLTGAPLFYSFLLTLTLAWLGQSTFGPALFTDELGNRRPLVKPDRQTIRQSILFGGLIFLALGAALLLNIGGIGAAAQNIAGWIAEFASPLANGDWLATILDFVRYEFIVLILGGTAVIWATWRGLPYPMFLIYWLVAAILLAFFQRGYHVNALVLAMPGILLVGVFVDDVMKVRTGFQKWAIAGLFILIGGVVIVNLGRYTRLLSSDQPLDVQARYYHLLAILLALVILILALTISWSWHRKSVGQGVVIGLLVLLIGFSWSTSLWLAREAANDSRERWVDVATDDDMRLLAQVIQQVSWQVRGSPDGLEIVSSIDNPALRWYLRDMTDLNIGSVLPPSTDSSALISGFERDSQLSSEYIGIDFGFLRPDTEHTLSSGQLLSWWLFHDSPIPISEQRLIFWLRSDLAGEE